VQIWPGGDRRFERKLHNRHGSRLCPEPSCVAAQLQRRLQLPCPSLQTRCPVAAGPAEGSRGRSTWRRSRRSSLGGAPSNLTVSQDNRAPHGLSCC
jgi:hypothetical protein